MKTIQKKNLFSTDKAWKVRFITECLQREFKRILSSPGQYLAVDEGMGLCFSKLNPIKRVLPNKPISTGFKWFILCDCETKIITNFNIDDGNLQAKNFKDIVGGFVGAQVTNLIDYLDSTGHIVVCDNYYSSVGLAQNLISKGHGLIATLRKDKVSPVIRSTASAPSTKTPKGSFKSCYLSGKNIFEHSLMDSKMVYFIETIYGGDVMSTIKRGTRRSCEKTEYAVLACVSQYNKFMGAVDVSDQVRNGP